MDLFSCWLHFLIVGSIVAYTVLLAVFNAIFSNKKKEVGKKTKNKFVKFFKSLSNLSIAYIANVAFHVILWIVYVIIPHCWLCTVLLILFMLWIIISMILVFFKYKFVKWLLKKFKNVKKTKRNTKIISKLTNWKFQIEFDESTVTLNDAFNMCPTLHADKTFDLSKINKIVGTFGENEIIQDQNIGGNKMIQDCWNYCAVIKSNKGKKIKEIFAYLFDLRKNNGKDKAALLLLKIEPRERKELFRFFPNAAVSKFPLGKDFIAFPITDCVSLNSCEIYLKKAYEYVRNSLEEEEFEKIKKDIKK